MKISNSKLWNPKRLDLKSLFAASTSQQLPISLTVAAPTGVGVGVTAHVPAAPDPPRVPASAAAPPTVQTVDEY